MIITLDWPPATLSPNNRAHWSALARAKSTYRFAAMIFAREAFNAARPTLIAPLAVAVTFCPPDKRGRDMDNMVASIKAGLDGVSDAIGVDDRHWQLTIARGDPCKGGKVIVAIGQMGVLP